MITDFRQCMIDGTYGNLFFDDYERYVKKQVWLVRKHHKGGRILSVGCGTGDIEALLPFEVVCHDIHNACQILHPELNFQASWPTDRFETVMCLGTVLPFVPTDDQPSFINNLINSTTKDGQVLVHGIKYQPTEQNSVKEYVYPCKWPTHNKIKVLG